ncbi:MAG: polyprenyl synthetase family protein [Desulfotomaculales bacterium]
MNFLRELAVRGRLVEEALDRYLPPADHYPPIIHEAMRYSVFAGGKRLRPVLVLAAAEVVGGSSTAVMPAACGLELIHTYSLIHDDLPAMDNDDFRRGKPASHKVFGEAIAILAGDALLTLAFELIARCAVEGLVPAARVARAVYEISRAAGSEGLIGGQVVDITGSGRPLASEDVLWYMHEAKTAVLYRVALRTGAILGGGTEESIELLGEFGRHFGMAFQITDDILDIEGEQAKLGKPVGSDVRNRKHTSVTVLGLSRAKEEAHKRYELALEALAGFGSEADFLRAAAEFIIAREF